ncbi:MAG: hypothetical protein FJ000_05890 [Actinobacteria bacterium]|nr:hypothetical protein [Actinomycetota bacterium]
MLRSSRHVTFLPALATAVLTASVCGLPQDSARAYPTTQRPLTACDFVSPTTGWVVGEHGVVLRTVNAGRLWHRQRSSRLRAERLHDVDFVDRSRGWAVGSGGLILVTRDAGASWLRRSSDRTVDLRAVAATGPDSAVVVGWSGPAGAPVGEILRSADSGSTWVGVGAWPGTRLHDVVFADRSHGWAVGSGPAVGSGAAAESAVVLATGDGGQTWTAAAGPEDLGIDPGRSSALFAVEALDASRLWCAGRSGPVGAAHGLLARSLDGGRSWRAVLSRRFTSFRGLAFGSRSRGWAIGRGAGAALLATRDGGRNWQVRSLPRGTIPAAIDFVDGRRGWIVGDTRAQKGLVLRTADAGRRWSRLR